MDETVVVLFQRKRVKQAVETNTESSDAWTWVSFRIFSPELDPLEISRILETVPDRTCLRGTFPQNDPKYAPYKNSVWTLDSKLPAEEAFIQHLENLFSILKPKQKQILELSRTHTVDFMGTLFSQNGIYVPSHVIAQIADLGAELNVTVYP